MDCELPDGTAWPALLAARTLLAHGATSFAFVQRGGEWTCAGAAPPRGADQVVTIASTHEPPPPPAPSQRTSVYGTDDRGLPTFVHPTGSPVDQAMLALLRVYLPVMLGAAAARRTGKVFVVGHVTQTLDGRIACANRVPQWIGNAADRRHAHRMRALCDAVMVGAATALGDDPQLTVRDVPGPNPRRIVLSGSGRVLRAGRALRLFADPGSEVLVAAHADAPARTGAAVVRVAASNGVLAPSSVLAALAAQGVHSVYLEGGTRTLSSFLAGHCLDLLQVHVAPIVLGSGLPSFELPVVDSIAAGQTFAMQHATLDDDVLLSCWPQRRTRECRR